LAKGCSLRTGLDGAHEIGDGNVLVAELRVVVVQPANLLQHLGVVRVILEHTLVGLLRRVELFWYQKWKIPRRIRESDHMK
jgi:hypothetical protein